MNAENDYIQAERKNIEKTVQMLLNLMGREKLSEYEVIALGKLLQDIYMGIERILRCLLECRGIEISKSSGWHKEILIKARDENLISLPQFNAFTNLLLFRHLQIHGYGYNLDEKRLQELAAPVPDLCRDFLQNLP